MNCDKHNKRLTPGGDCLSCLFEALDARKHKEEQDAFEKSIKGGKRKCPGHKDRVDLDRFGRCSKCGGFPKQNPQ